LRPLRASLDATFPTTLRQPVPHQINPPTFSERPRGMFHTLKNFIAFARPGNESSRDPWIEPRGERFSIDPIV